MREAGPSEILPFPVRAAVLRLTRSGNATSKILNVLGIPRGRYQATLNALPRFARAVDRAGRRQEEEVRAMKAEGHSRSAAQDARRRGRSGPRRRRLPTATDAMLRESNRQRAAGREDLATALHELGDPKIIAAKRQATTATLDERRREIARKLQAQVDKNREDFKKRRDSLGLK